MTLPRRSFFAALLSPLVALCAPKHNSLTEVINQGTNPEWDGMIDGICLYERERDKAIVNLIEARMESAYQQMTHYLDYECGGVGTGYLNGTFIFGVADEPIEVGQLVTYGSVARNGPMTISKNCALLQGK